VLAIRVETTESVVMLSIDSHAPAIPVFLEQHVRQVSLTSYYCEPVHMCRASNFKRPGTTRGYIPTSALEVQAHFIFKQSGSTSPIVQHWVKITIWVVQKQISLSTLVLFWYKCCFACIHITPGTNHTLFRVKAALSTTQYSCSVACGNRWLSPKIET